MTNCEACAYYSYDEDYECYICEMDLDVPGMNTVLCGTRCDGAWEISFFKSGRHSLSLNFYIPIIINL